MTEFVKIERDNSILTLTLARPDKKNALTNDMYGALADALEGAETDGTTRVILLQADGDMFTAGNDLSDFARQSAGQGPTERHVTRFLHALARSSRPLVAAVQGRAVGIGTTMLLHCDMVLVADGTLLTTPFVNLALVPEAASSLLMPARIGHVRAFEMFALGEPVTAANAVAWGLANRSVPADALRGQARELAERLAAQPLGALVASKKLIREPQVLLERMQAEGEIFAQRLRSAEAAEAFAAFAERRPPDFSRVAG